MAERGENPGLQDQTSEVTCPACGTPLVYGGISLACPSCWNTVRAVLSARLHSYPISLDNVLQGRVLDCTEECYGLCPKRR